jgi:hypothetical protein
VSWTRAAGGWLAGAAAALAAVAALGAWPAARWGGADGPRALLAGCAVAAVGALAGALPVLATVARGASRRPHVVAGWSMALRFGVTLAGLAAVALGTGLPRAPLALAVAAAYGALLVTETRWTLRWLRAGAA